MLVRTGVLVAITAIDRFAAVRLERNLGIHAAAGANGIVHLALGTIVTAAATAAVATTASAAAAITTAATATVAATAATTLFSGIPAGFALFGGLKPFGLIKLLLFLGKREACSAVYTGQFRYSHDDRNLELLDFNKLDFQMRPVDMAQNKPELKNPI